MLSVQNGKKYALRALWNNPFSVLGKVMSRLCSDGLRNVQIALMQNKKNSEGV